MPCSSAAVRFQAWHAMEYYFVEVLKCRVPLDCWSKLAVLYGCHMPGPLVDMLMSMLSLYPQLYRPEAPKQAFDPFDPDQQQVVHMDNQKRQRRS